MKKTVITFLVAGLFITSLKAQTIQEGMNHLYADRFKSAIGVFEKLLAANPNNIEATYWLGQVYFDMDDNAKARQIYQKALETNGSAPLVLVGLGHADLHDNKTADARQKFEAAITAATPNAKKGPDITVLTAIGRANVDAKAGDFNYAIAKLTQAADKGEKNTETLLQLGNAYRKARPGEGGGEAFKNYKKALEIDPKFAVADLRLAKLFESQKNWELVLEYLNSAANRDPKFAPAYYELFYYNFFRAKFPEAEAQLAKYIANSDNGWEKEYLEAQLNWAKKDFSTAIAKAESVIMSTGALTKPKVYRLLADAYFQKADYNNAKKYSDIFFAKKTADDLILPDYEIKAEVLSKLGGTPDEVFNTYMAGVALDTTADAKVGFLKKAAAYFKTNKIRDKEGDIIQKLIELKPKPSINDYFDLTLARYFTPDYSKSRDAANVMIEKFPDQVYGYEWKFNSSNAIDTVKKDSIAVPDALQLLAFAEKDTAKFKKQYLSSVKFLGGYYINNAKNKEKALEYFTKWLQADPANTATIQGIIDQINKMPNTAPKGTTPSAAVKPAEKEATVNKDKSTLTTVNKTTTKK